MNSRQLGLAGVAGVVLVALGATLLFERIFGPVFRPLVVAINSVGWPLVLIGIGVLLMNRRGGAQSASQPRSLGGGLRRSRSDRVIGGVIGGISARSGMDSTVLRVVFALITLFGGVWLGVVLYVVALIVIPEESAFPTTFAPAAPAPPAPPVPHASPVPPTAPSGPASAADTVTG